MSGTEPRPSKFPGRCKVCGGWIKRDQPCLLAPFRHPGCPAWKVRELLTLEAVVRPTQAVSVGSGPSPQPAAVPGRSGPPWVVMLDAGTINDRLAVLARDLLAIDRQHDGYVRFNPDHAGRCQQTCVSRRQVVEDEIAELRTALAIRVVQEETA